MVKQMVSSSYSFQNQTDEFLCRLALSGDRHAEEQLVVRYSRLVLICARPYFLAGGDSEDLIQEGMLGLLSAIREYSFQRDTSFRTFAEICIRRRLFSAIKAAAGGKHAPLNDSVSIETPLLDDGTKSRFPLGNQALSNPEELVLAREAFQEKIDCLNGQLSGFEAKVLRLYLNGFSYSEIAAEVGRSTKAVDNAVQRVRKKLARQFSSGEFSEG